MDTRIINEKNNLINNLKNEYTKELNTVNYYFWPRVAESKKKLSNKKYYTLLSGLFIVILVVCVILFEITDYYWLGFGLGVPILIFCLNLYFTMKHNKKHKKLHEDWKLSLMKSEALKKKLLSECEIATNMMLEFFGDDKQKIITDIGMTYEDILDYYNHWVDNNLLPF